MFVIIVALALVIFSAVDAYSDCHNDEPCEDVHNDVISEERWQTDHNNTVRYYVNNNFLPILPSLYPDVTSASSKWTRIRYNREEVNFRLSHQGTTSLRPRSNSQKNIVGWGSLPWNDEDNVGIVGAVYHTYANNNRRRIIGADMVLNYYAPFFPHSKRSSANFCLRNVLTHEFGHFIRLLDADAEGEDCDDYADYTMFNDAGPGRHYQESLACEDKYCTWYTYNEMRWVPAAAPPAHVKAETTGETKLLHNYPDPFNPETWIPYELAADTDVSITIYDSDGRLVRHIDVGQKVKGQYINKEKAVYWDGKDDNGQAVASGLYFYTLNAGQVSDTRRLVVVK